MTAKTESEETPYSPTSLPQPPVSDLSAPITDSLIATELSEQSSDTVSLTEQPESATKSEDKDNLGESMSGDSIFSVNFANPTPTDNDTTPPTTSNSNDLTPAPADLPTTPSMTTSTDSYVMVSNSSPSPPQTISDSQTEPKSKPDVSPSPAQEWMDVLGNGSLKKLVVNKADSQQPVRGQRVRIDYTGHLNVMEGEIVEQELDLEVEVGAAEVVQGLDLIIPLMMQGELSWVYMESRFGYGDAGNGTNIPARAELYYLIRLKEINSRYDYANLTEEKLIELVERKKTRGNNLFKMNQLSQAITAYNSAVTAIQAHQYSATPEGKSTGCRILTNLAITQYKYEHKHESLASCDSALALQPNDTKALYRKSVILTERHEYAEALVCLEAAFRASPEDKVVEQESRRVRELRDQSNRRQRNVYRRMIQGETAPKQEATEGGESKKVVIAIIVASSIVAVAAVCVGMLVLRKN